MRDPVALILIFGVPLFAFLVLSAAFSHPVIRGLGVVVVDEDRSEVSRAFVQQVAASPNLDIVERTGDLSSAARAIRSGDAIAAIYIPANFERDLKAERRPQVVTYQVHPVLPSDHCVRSGRAARATRAQSEPECLCGALGQVGEGGVPVQGDPLWRALPAASLARICRALPCRAESPREGQCPTVPSGYEHSPRGTCSMPRPIGRTIALLPSGSGMSGASDEFFDLTACSRDQPNCSGL